MVMENLKLLLGKSVMVKTDTKGTISGIVREAWSTGIVIGHDAIYLKNIRVLTEWEDY